MMAYNCAVENEKLSATIVVILGLGTAAAVNHTIDEQTPACKVSAPDRVTVQSCRDKEPAMTHLPDPIDTTSQSVNAANAIRQIMATPAQYPFAYFSEPEMFVKPWRGNLLITSPAAA
jgi:hypothetical protein